MKNTFKKIFLIVMVSFFIFLIIRYTEIETNKKETHQNHSERIVSILSDYEDMSDSLPDFEKALHNALISLTKNHVVYDPTYFSIPYPMGDVPSDKGVCTDVVIRAYRKLGIDLQELVHNDMKNNFSKYPNKWGLTKTDTNIDHRRVPNLMVFFERFGESKPITQNGEDYLPGDIIIWDLGSGITHIGMITGNKSKTTGNYLVVHNIGTGQVLEDMLFKFKITGHFIFNPS